MFYKIIISTLLFFSFSSGSTDIKKLQSFKAKFSQNIKSTSGNIIEYSGDVFIKNTGKILWQYKTPIVKNVYIINDFAIVDEPELEQAIYTQLQSEINIIKLLNNASKINNNTYTAKIDDIDYLIETSKTDNKIQSIKYKDKLDNNVEINFSDSIEDEQISDEVFKFTAPEHYDIIRK